MSKSAIDAKVKCKECDYEDHILIPHLRKKHGYADGGVSYLDKHGGFDKAPLWSTFGYAYIQRQNKGRGALAVAPRPRTKIQISKLFPEFGKRTKTKPRGEVEIFATPGPLTPKLDPNYIFPEEQTLDLIVILEKTRRNRPYVKGWSGTGKTELFRNLAAKFNAELVEFNADSQLQRSEIVGHPDVKDGETIFSYGLLPIAMMNGYWCLVNEIDTLDPHTLNIFKPVLEDPPRLTILENGREMITEGYGLHPDFRIMASANTWASGDPTGLFAANTMTQSDADRRRWSARIVLDYMAADVEQEMLMRYFGDDLETDEPMMFVKVANKVRDAFKVGKIDKTFSPAEMINWVENYLACGKTVHHAARLSFLNACEPDVKTAIEEMVTAIFGVESGRADETTEED